MRWTNKSTHRKTYIPAFQLGRVRVIESRRTRFTAAAEAQYYAMRVHSRWLRLYKAWLALPAEERMRIRPDLFPAPESVSQQQIAPPVVVQPDGLWRRLLAAIRSWLRLDPAPSPRRTP
jgi:hypothetical protein